MSKPRCEHCKWFSPTVGPFGDCMCWADFDRKKNPESAKVVKVVMAKWQGKKCPTYQRKPKA